MELTNSLSISIFCREADWHHIIIECVFPFIKRTKELDNFYLSLSRFRGNHIKLFLIVSNKSTLQILKKVDLHLRNYLIKNKIDEKTKILPPSDGIFCDFKPNTVHYGVYELSANFNYLHNQLSELLFQIFDYFRDETIGSLTEIMIELFSIFYMYSSMSKTEVEEVFNNLLENELTRYKSTSNKIQEMYKEDLYENCTLIGLYIKNKEHDVYKLLNYQKKWLFIILNYQKWLGKEQKNKIGYLMGSICNIFDFRDKITVFYLFSFAIKNSNCK